MKLTKLELSAVRRFHALTLTFRDGLNLIAGPNESGKSTVVEALRAAFFVPHGSKSEATGVRKLLPWNAPNASPRVIVVFEHAGTTYTLDKQFLRKPSCTLGGPPRPLGGTEAERFLTDLLSFSPPSTSAKQAAQAFGVSGLLWITQGTAQDLKGALERAEQPLERCIEAALEELASARALPLLRSLKRELERYYGNSGAPVDALRAAQKEREAAEAKVDELRKKRTEHLSRLDALRRLVEREAEADVEDQRLAEDERCNKQRLDSWNAARQRLQDLQRELDALRARREALSERRRRIDEREEALRKAQAELHGATRRLEELEGRRRGLLLRMAELRQELSVLEARRERASRMRERKRLATERQSQHEAFVALENGYRKALDLDAHVRRLDADIRATDPGEETVRHLRTLHNDVETSAARLDALALRIRYRLEPGVTIQLDDIRLNDEGERIVDRRAELKIPGIGILELEPGGSELEPRRRALETARAALRDALARAGMTSLEEAERRRERAARLREEHAGVRQALGTLAPTGLDGLERRLEETRRTLEDLDTRLAALGTADGADDDVEQLDAALSQLHKDIGSGESDLRGVETELARLRRQIGDLEAHIAYGEQQLAQALGEDARDPLDAQMSELEQAIETRTIDRQSLCARHDPTEGARFEAQRRDYEVKRRTLENDRRLRSGEIHQLRAELRAFGADGLENQLAEAEARLEAARDRERQLFLRAQALRWLVERIERRRQECTAELRRPVQSRVAHYVTRLFPRAEIQFGDPFVPSQLVRAEGAGALSELSFGTQEQIGLLCRLAYADLLGQRGFPTLMVLDDVLAYTDRERLDVVKRVLVDAAQRHQILLFTCHPEDFLDLGVAPQYLPPPGA
ncbi:MAG: AAA family ATPase [Myxococcota bacterium]|nr:AAA family ATPase [Myxococcota bacterium]MDW8361664.1 AAA family ATPase [Myxococcales bacterium]